MTAPAVMPSGGLPSTTAAQQYADLYRQYHEAQAAIAAMPPTGFGQSPEPQAAAQQRLTSIFTQLQALQKQIIDTQPAPPAGYHWGVLPSGEPAPVKNGSRPLLR
jgi:hypothetical protein